MTVDLFSAMQAEHLAAEKPPPLKLYLVLAWSKHYGWRVRRGEFLTVEAAKRHAESLSHTWTIRRIYELGEEGCVPGG